MISVAQSRHHYEQAFAAYLRSRRVPYVAVNEARKAILPAQHADDPDDPGPALKSFDFVLYGHVANLLVEIKGRKVSGGTASTRRPRLECWVTQDDVDSLRAWERLFGEGFTAALVFIYWCDQLPPEALFEEMIEHQGRWYALRVVTISTYAAHMRPRSPRWRTVHLPAAAFERESIPLSRAIGLPRPAAALA
jgi:hypothetical protein